ncbi:MAG: PDDEXK nuclease domain-containing protein [Alphaproteobacteria bacterium]|nr:PDDEXK nuclease domain-containing protein [Alphaproteobacteria bacterium]
MSDIPNDSAYFKTLKALKDEIYKARVRAHLTINQELTLLYWKIGKEIVDRKKELGWGSKVVDLLSQDLRHEFPEMKGLSTRNLIYMQTFALAYPDYEFTQQAAAQIPWGHNQAILDKVSDPEQRIWYIKKTIENGWSRNVLALQIENRLHDRMGKALTNFKNTLPSSTSDLAQSIFKSEYNLEFLDIKEKIHERELENKLIDRIRDFLLELGTGFAFIGSQYKLTVAGDEFLIDLLFYQTKLQCYIVLELKSGKFQPSYLGQLEFYLTIVDSQIKLPSDKSSIGLLLCREANQLVVEYALKTKSQPMGVSKYILSANKLPLELENALPTPEQFKHFFIEEEEM